MLPDLLVGDRLVVSKYPYGYSFVSPTFHMMPFMKGRLFGSLPERGDVVIVTPPGTRTDYIKRVIGLHGDTLEVRGGQVILNGVPVKRGRSEEDTSEIQSLMRDSYAVFCVKKKKKHNIK